MATIYCVKSLRADGSVGVHAYCLSYSDAEKIKHHIQSDPLYAKKYGIEHVLVLEKREKTYKQFLEEVVKSAKKERGHADKKLNLEIEKFKPNNIK